jgi:hypothetical protein
MKEHTRKKEKRMIRIEARFLYKYFSFLSQARIKTQTRSRKIIGMEAENDLSISPVAIRHTRPGRLEYSRVCIRFCRGGTSSTPFRGVIPDMEHTRYGTHPPRSRSIPMLRTRFNKRGQIPHRHSVDSFLFRRLVCERGLRRPRPEHAICNPSRRSPALPDPVPGTQRHSCSTMRDRTIDTAAVLSERMRDNVKYTIRDPVLPVAAIRYILIDRSRGAESTGANLVDDEQ